jgi:LuxR family maltose regulon positive regulatory protein
MTEAPAYLREFEQTTFARLLLARGVRDGDDDALAAAAALAERLLGSAEAGGRYGAAIDVGVVLAIVRHRRHDLDGALTALDGAFAHAEPEGHVRVFLDEGERMTALLRLAAKDRPYARRLLDQAEPLVGRTPPAAATAAHGLVEPLSERELDVLRLLQSDLSGPDIADQLYVSVNTVRTHTKSIYAKLDVNTRRAAVRRAADLGLLPRDGVPPA